MSMQINLLYLVAFLDLFAVGLVVPLIANHVKDLGNSHLVIGLMGSLYSGFQLGSGPLIGSLSDLNGRKFVLILTILCAAFAYLAFGLFTSTYVLLCLRIVLGIFKQTQMLTKALVADYENDEYKQSTIYGKMVAISGAGITLGPVLGGHLMEDFPHIGFQINAMLTAIIFVVNAALIYAVLTPVESTSAHKKININNLMKNQNYIAVMYKSLKRSFEDIASVDWITYWDVFLFKALVGFSMGVYYSNHGLLLKSKYNLSPKYIGYTISIQGVIGSCSSFLIAYVNSLYKQDHDYTQRNLHCFVLMSISLIGLTISSHMYSFIFWVIPLAVGNTVIRLVGLEMVLKRSLGQHRGTLIGATNSVRSLSGVVSPLVGGVLAHYFGTDYILGASAFCAVIGTVISMYIRSKSKPYLDPNIDSKKLQ